MTLEDAIKEGIVSDYQGTKVTNKPAGHQRQLPTRTSISGLQLNYRYLGELARITKVLNFVVLHRIRKIQAFYREHYGLKVFAANLIRKRWRAYSRSKESKLKGKAAIEYMRKKLAINRIAEFFKLIKVKKVTAQSQLCIDQISSHVSEMQKEGSFIQKVTKIQKWWRNARRRFSLTGIQIIHQHRRQVKLWNRVVFQRYQGMQNAESEMLSFFTHHFRE